MVKTDFTFFRAYEVEEPGDFPGSGSWPFPVIHFPGPRPNPNGLWLRISPAHGKTWIGVFAFLFGQSSCSLVVSCPDPSRFCVISQGASYIVKADEPRVWEKVAIEVVDLNVAPEHELLLFSGYTRLAAYGKDGLVWKSSKLCWDELKILKITQDTVEGTGYDPTNSAASEMRFVVDIRTGRSLLRAITGVDEQALC